MTDDADLLEALGSAQPLYYTRPDDSARHDLEKIEKVAALLGQKLLPWQRFVARVATELTPDGAYRYPVVLLCVPRQSGKTTLFRTRLAARCLSRPHVKAFATAQTGKDATERLFELSDAIETSRIGKTIKVRRAAGTSRITFHNGSKIQAFSPTPESLHGYTPNIVFLDEIFSFTQMQGDLLMGAITPAMQTVKDRQLLMCSTKGTQDSTFLNDWIEKGRQATQDPDSQIAYFEWSLADDLDPFDPANWDFHPGLAGGLITKADIQQASETISKGEFTRAYMNRPTQTADTLF
ncbi:terminase large subunit, partial [Micrococcus luteus]|nr:terminase large subunit [Micrococcus luteus]